MTQPRRSPVRRLLRAVLVLLVLGAVVVGLIYSLQRNLIYFPDTAPPPPAGQVLPGARDVSLHTSDGLELGAWLVPAEKSGDTGMAVVYLPGNGGNRAGRAPVAEELAARGLTVLLVDYRGYGGNEGSPSEDGLARDAVAAHEVLVAEGFGPERQIYLGESLGTGVAAALAAQRPPAGLLLRSPFTELADIGRTHYPWLPVGLLLRDRYPVLEHVEGMRFPVTVVRGTADTIVPARFSREVAQAAPQLAEELVLEGVGHNDPEMFGAPVADAVARLAAEVGPTSAP